MKPLSDWEIELDCQENAGRTALWENVVGVCIAGIVSILAFCSCTGCGR